jgi:cobalamin biosynthesis protein CobD/CbiB
LAYDDAREWSSPVTSSGAANFAHALVAVLAGNAVYFLLGPYLPPAARHVAPRLDLGMVVDFWICLVIFGLIKTAARRRRNSARKL